MSECDKYIYIYIIYTFIPVKAHFFVWYVMQHLAIPVFAVFDSPGGPVLTRQGFHLHPISGQSVQSAGSLNHLSHLSLCFVGSLLRASKDILWGRSSSSQADSEASQRSQEAVATLELSDFRHLRLFHESVCDLVALQHASPFSEAWWEIQPSHGSVRSIEVWRNLVTFPILLRCYASRFEDLPGHGAVSFHLWSLLQAWRDGKAWDSWASKGDQNSTIDSIDPSTV